MDQSSLDAKVETQKQEAEYIEDPDAGLSAEERAAIVGARYLGVETSFDSWTGSSVGLEA